MTALPSEDTGFTVQQATQPGGGEVSLQVVALFSVSIPVIVRDGPADARAAIENPAIVQEGEARLLSLDLVRLGASSVYGDVEILSGQGADAKIITAVRGVAVYPEVARASGAPLMPFLMEGVALHPAYVLPDRIHPNALGVGRMADALAPHVRAALEALAASGPR